MDIKHIKRVFVLIGEHLIFAVLSLFFISVFPWALKYNTAKIIYTVVMGFAYSASVYGSSWRNSAKDYRTYKSLKKKMPEFDVQFKLYMGFIYGIGIFVLNIALLLLACNAVGVWNVVFRVFNFAFFGLVIDEKEQLSVIGGVIASVIPLAASGMGYIAGRFDFSISEKYLPGIIYKKPNKK